MLLKRYWSTGVWLLYLIIFLTLLCFIPDVRHELQGLAAVKLGGFSLTGPNFEPPPRDDDRPDDFGDPNFPSAENSVEEFQQESRHDPITLGAWLKSRGITADITPIVTIGDSKYLRVLHSLQHRLELWGRGQDLVVLCLDAACAEDKALRGYPGYVQDDEKVMHSVALLKFRANLELAQNGYNFVFLDGDVFLTGSRDPFNEMLALSNDSWDVQFQQDDPPPSRLLNIGWYFARASPATLQFFERSFARWNETQAWDQRVMNEIAWDMERANYSETDNGSRLRIHRLEMATFQNFMHVSWENTLFGNKSLAASFVNESAIIHFTCIEQSLKTYMGLNFGGFADVDGYYSNAPPLLRITNISGTSDAIHRQVAFALQLTASTNRTLIWPDSVSILQQNKDSATDQPLYALVPRFPGALAVNYDVAERAGFSLVEGRYLQNQQRYKQEQVDEITISVNSLLETDIAQFEHLITDLRSDVVPVLDFENFGAEWIQPGATGEPNMTASAAHVQQAHASFDRAYQQSGMEAYAKEALEKVAKCRWADGGGVCLHYC